MSPEYTASERIADGCVHLIGLTACLAAVPALMIFAIPAQQPLSLASLAIYSTGLVAMLGFSAGYNLAMRPNWKKMLRRCDHAAIFVMIAGTYTPFSLIAIGGAWGHGLLAAVWIIALLGVAIVLLAPHKAERVTIGIYLLQGWAILLAIEPLRLSVSDGGLALLLAGGLLYTVGIVFHLWRRLPYHNAIWHVFVLVAAACHYFAVLDTVALARTAG